MVIYRLSNTETEEPATVQLPVYLLDRRLFPGEAETVWAGGSACLVTKASSRYEGRQRGEGRWQSQRGWWRLPAGELLSHNLCWQNRGTRPGSGHVNSHRWHDKSCSCLAWRTHTSAVFPTRRLYFSRAYVPAKGHSIMKTRPVDLHGQSMLMDSQSQLKHTRKQLILKLSVGCWKSLISAVFTFILQSIAAKHPFNQHSLSWRFLYCNLVYLSSYLFVMNRDLHNLSHRRTSLLYGQ